MRLCSTSLEGVGPSAITPVTWIRDVSVTGDIASDSSYSENKEEGGSSQQNAGSARTGRVSDA